MLFSMSCYCNEVTYELLHVILLYEVSYLMTTYDVYALVQQHTKVQHTLLKNNI